MSDEQWFYAVTGSASGREHAGPVTAERVHAMLASGAVLSDTPVWREGMVDWAPVRDVPEFAPYAGAAEVPSPPTLPYRFGTVGGPPAAPLEYYAARAEHAPYAGFWLRFVAAVIDGVITTATGAVVGGAIGAVIGLVLGAGGFSVKQLDTAVTVMGQVTGYVIGWLYEALMTSSSRQATLGKLALGLKVTDLHGAPISFGRATGRHFAKILSGLLLLIGYIMAGFTERKQALHDIMAGTLIVRK